MRIYEGSPRTGWEDVLRTIGAYADQQRLKELLFLELDEGFILQGLGPPTTGTWSESSGTLTKRTFELVEDQISQLVDESVAHRGEATVDHATVEVANYYRNALRIIGQYIDAQHARDVFLFEQDGAFVVRLLIAGQTGVGHHLAEFTRADMLAMIDAAPQQRVGTSETPAGG